MFMQCCSPAEGRWRKRPAVEHDSGFSSTVHIGVTSEGSDPVCLAVAQSALTQESCT